MKSAAEVCPVKCCPNCGSPRLHYCPGDIYSVAGWECRKCGEFVAGRQPIHDELQREEVA